MKIVRFSLFWSVYILSLIGVSAQGVEYIPLPLPNSSGALNIRTRTLVEMRYVDMIRQSHDLSCGAAAAATILHNVYDVPVGEKEVIEAILSIAPEEDRDRIAQAGFSMLELKRFFEAAGFVVGGFKVPSVEDLDNLNVPVIALINVRGYNHFVVLKRKVGDEILIADPAFGNTRISSKQFANQWNGVMLVIVAPGRAPNPKFFDDRRVTARPLELQSIRSALNAAEVAFINEY